MKLHVESPDGDSPPVAVIDDEPDPQRWDLLFDFMRDVDGSEDLSLAALDRAEAGSPELNWANNYVSAKMYPDGRVVITQLDYLLEDNEKDHPPQTVITIAEARKLILDWIEARDKWYAEREPMQPQRSNEPQSVFRRCWRGQSQPTLRLATPFQRSQAIPYNKIEQQLPSVSGLD